MAGQQQYDVFLSHNSKDKKAVRKLYKKLKKRGLHPWFDEANLRPGRPWQEALEEEIENVKSAAVLVAKDGVGPWQSREIRAFLEEFVARGLPVIPVLLPGAPGTPQLPLFLRACTWVDLRDGLTKKGLDKLVWGITGQKVPQPPAGSASTAEATSGGQAPEQVGSKRSGRWVIPALLLVGAAGAVAYGFCRASPVTCRDKPRIHRRLAFSERPEKFGQQDNECTLENGALVMNIEGGRQADYSMCCVKLEDALDLSAYVTAKPLLEAEHEEQKVHVKLEDEESAGCTRASRQVFLLDGKLKRDAEIAPYEFKHEERKLHPDKVCIVANGQGPAPNRLSLNAIQLIGCKPSARTWSCGWR